jgi:4-amino-4-deoxy-L-arabinose transferase-like glycosyltransferase
MLIQLLLSTGLFIPSIVLYCQGKEKKALWALMAAAFLVRLLVIQLDPYLHDWDERFHAVVAKNMMIHPFQPMLRTEALLPYEMEDWCCNYIWVHKPPLFLWQMAISMKLFGVNLIALRLPDVIMGVFMVYWIHRIAWIWTENKTTAYLAALLYAASFYSAQLMSGILSLDHNDLMMGGYITASIWAFCEFTVHKSWKWALLTGVLAGCAILVKWLFGWLVYGIWGLYVLYSRADRFRYEAYLPMVKSFAVCAAVFLPWQIYIRWAFPAETAATHRNYMKHFTESLGHEDSIWAHLSYMDTAYSGYFLVVLLVVGMLLSWKNTTRRKLTFALTGAFLFVYAFFSILVMTKMRGFTFPVSAIGFTWIAIGAEFLLRQLQQRVSLYWRSSLGVVLYFALVLYAFQPFKMVEGRDPASADREVQIHNTNIYKILHKYVGPDEIILNCKDMEDTELRFWQPNNAYHWCPSESEVNRLLQQGYRLAVFKKHPGQKVPEYILNKPQIKILDLQLE